MYLPQMVSFKAFGIEATLTEVQEKLDRADEIIARLKSLAAADAKATYSLMAWGNRWNGIPAVEKQKIADKIDEQLNSFDFNAKDSADIKGEYVQLIGFDMAGYFENSLASYIIQRIGSDASRSAELSAWSKEFNGKQRLTLEKITGLDGAGLANFLKNELPRDKMKADDTIKFESFADRVGNIYDGCLKRQGYTSEATKFFEEFLPLAGGPLVAHVLK